MRTSQRIAIGVLTSALALCAGKSQARTVPSIHDGEHVILDGTLEIKCRGWRCYTVLKTDKAYVAEFDPQTAKPMETHEFGVSVDGANDLLAGQIEKHVRVEGKIQLEADSPYYWNGILLLASKVWFEDGRQLTPRVNTLLPVAAKQYVASLTLVRGSYRWSWTAVDLDSGKLLNVQRLDGCSLSGGGDVMNCSCVSGFVPTRAGVVTRLWSRDQIQHIPVADESDMPGVIQFEIPEDATRRLTVQVVCVQQKVGSH